MTPEGASTTFETLTYMQLGLIALFAVLVVMGILWGMRAKRRRTNAEMDAKAHAAGAPTSVAEPVAENATVTTIEEPKPAPKPKAAPKSKAAPAPKAKVAPAPVAEPKPKAPPKPRKEPVAEPVPAPKPAAKPAAKAAAEPVPAPVAAPADDLTTLKGLGPKVAAMLNEQGITRIADLAALSDTRAAEVDTGLGAFQGRMARDRWIEQAKLLAAGDTKGFEEAFGKL